MSSDEMFQLVILVVALAGAAVAVIVVRILRSNAWLKAKAIYAEEEFLEAQRTILLNYEDTKESLLKFNVSDEHAFIVCCKMDELARLKFFAGEEKIIEEWGVSIGRCWLILAGFVATTRKREERENKWIAFQCLAEKAIEIHNL